jgi:hypothetical protein
MVSKGFETAQCSSQVFLSFKTRTQQTDQRDKTEIQFHPIENYPIPAAAETILILPTCGVDLYSIALFASAATKGYTPVCLSHTSKNARYSFSVPFVPRFLTDEETILTFFHNR